MSTDLISVLPDEEIAYVHRLIRSKKIRHMLVVNPQNKLVGLLSHRDLMALPDDVYTSGAKRSIASVMIRDVLTIPPDHCTREAAKLLLQYKIGCLPIVDEEQTLLGIITESDFVALFAEHGVCDCAEAS